MILTKFKSIVYFLFLLLKQRKIEVKQEQSRKKESGCISVLVSKIFQIHTGCPNEDDCKTEKNNDSIPVGIPSNRKTLLLDIFRGENSHAHGFLFNSEFVSLDDQGRVIISSIAQLSLKETLVSKFTSTRLFEKFNLPEKDPLHGKVSVNGLEEKNNGVKGVSSTQIVTTEKVNLEASRICVSNSKQQKIFDICESNFGSPDHKVKPEGKSIGESLEVQIRGTPTGDDDPDKTFGDMELSPRLTNFINSGFVPESPTTDAVFKDKQIMVKDLFSTPKRSSKQNERTVGGSSACGKYNEMSTPIQNVDSNEPRSCKYTSLIVEDKQTPMAKLSGKSCSDDWQLRSTDKSGSIGKTRKFRRLLKHGDLPRRKPPDKLNTSTSRKETALCGSANHTGFKHGRAIGEKRKPNIATDFIEEEA
ncbi:hypothetical protein HAX54_051177, partial [Datura stramonium]|nr:hypothetical protein [Datura stramonium]